ncbi:M3 family oligoendopeptidase [Fictibacillus sp. KIGAM418]|uniref:M3 family oligoendopeptidase n=1 Tax=Fictibacillus marinisediminis TaxID=2878389 RepID=A0A9X2BET1_9BACL|nr:M3 family oligoendopeptidase [Fictibacillus marinisediminis]MCK6259299.1 M3 family oligoendopeptidase [Fictibacillus marinisediminis]
MKFSEFTYKRPNMEQLQEEFKQKLESFEHAASFNEQDEVMAELVSIRNHFETMQNIVHIRYTSNTEDPFYKVEHDFMDENTPVYQGMVSEFFQAIVHSKYRKELESKWGKHLFNLADAELKTYSPEVVEDLKLENKLKSRYVKLLSSAKIDFLGGKRTLAQLIPFTQSPERTIRKQAVEAQFGFFNDHKEELDRQYDELVKLRTSIAKKLGFSSFVELAYNRLNRTDYDKNMVKKFRDQVKEHIVPFCTSLREKQKARIGVDSLKFYDESFSFPQGNPKPKGDADWIVEQGAKIFKELSPETDEFYTFMVENELLDLIAKEGKAPGGYCTYISEYQSPFIFTNFNGSQGDIRVLLHEAGHAFQVYTSRGYEVPEYQFPTLEACEIHSMSMELITYPWMEQFFGEDTERYLYDHLAAAVKFIPYGVAVDEFQHFVYENPDASPNERKQEWRRLEKKYLPHRDFDGIEFLEEGGFWQMQTHIYRTPFYYIDYTLAQVCALQFWKRSRENHKAAWQDYLELCGRGGSLPFTELVNIAGLVSPFEEGCVKSVMDEVRKWEAQIDDTKFLQKA